MTTAQTNELTPRKPLRLWPGVVLAIVLVLGRYVVPLIAPEVELFTLPLALLGIFAGMLSALGILVWWMLFSRAPWLERLAAIILMIVAVIAIKPIVHESIRGGNMGYMLVIYSVPVLSLAIVIWAMATRRLSAGIRRVSLVAAMLLACVPFVLIRTAGVMGTGAELHLRWTPTPEQRLLAQTRQESEPLPLPPPAETPKTPVASKPEAAPAADPATTAAAKVEPSIPAPSKAEPTAPTAEKPAAAEGPALSEPRVGRVEGRVEWPGFRGPDRDGVIRGVRIKTDWAASPPVQLWRRPIGPGWSSFAVSGDLLYTQEQRGDEEIVACYRVSTGEPVWRHRDAARFWESNAGPGPRGTPTLHGNRVYAFGATGILNALDAATGAVGWSRNVSTDASRKLPEWGFTSSPLVIDDLDLVIVAASGSLAAYDLATGKPHWVGPRELGSYSSPHKATIGGVVQILLQSGSGVVSVAPADGAVLWQHEWKTGGATIVQPAVTLDGDILINANTAMGGVGLRRLAVTKSPDGWRIEERWTSTGLKPNFNDFVVHAGHAYGFDGSILACIDLADGKRKWKGGRYGGGQLVLLADQDVLLVTSEEGELALVGATTDGFKELAKFPALDAKTWNHPVVVGDVLLVRNGEEMAAFRLSLASR